MKNLTLQISLLSLLFGCVSREVDDLEQRRRAPHLTAPSPAAPSGDGASDATEDTDVGLERDEREEPCVIAERNTCGGCEPLEGAVGDRCGACGLLRCTDEGTLACNEVREGCDLCDAHRAEVDQPCGTCGKTTCTDSGEIVCEDPGRNSCGGCAELAGEPASACGTCGSFVCDGTERVSCQTPDTNACGGCSALAHQPDDACGSCGHYVCDPSKERTVCVEGLTNACGGCDALSGKPGDTCGACGTYVCDGSGELVCDDPGDNGCGGCEPLEAPVGQTCGTCGGKWRCLGHDHVTCSKPENACGGCGPVPVEVYDNETDENCDGIAGLSVCPDTSVSRADVMLVLDVSELQNADGSYDKPAVAGYHPTDWAIEFAKSLVVDRWGERRVATRSANTYVGLRAYGTRRYNDEVELHLGFFDDLSFFEHYLDSRASRFELGGGPQADLDHALVRANYFLDPQNRWVNFDDYAARVVVVVSHDLPTTNPSSYQLEGLALNTNRVIHVKLPSHDADYVTEFPELVPDSQVTIEVEDDSPSRVAARVHQAICAAPVP